MPFDGCPEQFVESQLKRDLRAALALLGPDGECWVQAGNQQHVYKPGENFCAVLAIDHVCGYGPRSVDARRALSEVIGGSAPKYNDTHTFQEVRAKFLEAIALA